MLPKSANNNEQRCDSTEPLPKRSKLDHNDEETSKELNACTDLINHEDDTHLTLLSKHKFLFDNNIVTYEKVDSFVKDLMFYCEGIVLPRKEFECVVGLNGTKMMGHHSIRQYFKYHLKRYCYVVTRLITGFGDLESLLALLCNDNTFHKMLVSEKEYYKYFLDLNFPILVNRLETYDDPRLFKAVCEVFKKCILNQHSVEFEDYLNAVLGLSENKSTGPFDTPKAIIRAATSTYYSSSHFYITHKIFIQSFYNSYKDFSLIYKFVMVIVEFLGFDLSQNLEYKKIFNSEHTNLDLENSLSRLSDLFEILKNSKTDLSCSVKIPFSEFVENIVNSVMYLTKAPDKVCYKLLKAAIEIHPLLVEKNLKNLLVYSMLADNSNCSEEYSSFLLKIFEIYSQLHRIQNLVSKMLPILKSSIEENPSYEECYKFDGNNNWSIKMKISLDAEKALPDEVLNYFSDCTVQIASWQVMNLFKTFVFHLDSTVTNFSNANEGNQICFLELLCKFFSCFLRSIRMAENTVTTTVMDNFSLAMNEFKNILGRFGEALLKQEYNQSFVGAFLNLSYNWAEMYIIFHYYNKSHIQDEEIFYNTNHPNYLMSFLTTKQWFLLSQRITNFGESNCKNLMLKLLVQKLRAMYIFKNEINEASQREILEHISSDVEDYKYIISEKFISAYLLDQMDHEVLLKLAEEILRTNKTLVPAEVCNSSVLSTAVTYTTLLKIAKIFKMKSKYLFVKIFTGCDEQIYLGKIEDNESCFATLKNIFEENLWTNDEIWKNEYFEKIEHQLILLKQLPLPYLSLKMQSLILLCLFSLHKNVKGSDNAKFKDCIEEIIVGLLQVMKIDLLNLFEPVSLVKNVTLNFSKKETIISLLSENIINNEDYTRRFISGIKYLLDNIYTCDNLQHSLTILNDLQKVKKSKNSKQFKDVCAEIRDMILDEYFKIATTKKVDTAFLQCYVCCLKNSLNQENGDKRLSKLTDLLDSYLNIVFESKNDVVPKGSTSLFSTILHNKQVLKIPSDLPLRIWKYCKIKQVPLDDSAELSQLLCQVFEQIPNEEFEDVVNELLILTDDPLQKKDFSQLLKHLNIWSCILTSKFNPIKFKVWQQMLEKLLFKLSSLKGEIAYNQQVFDEVMHLEIAIIQQPQLHLSPCMIGVFLMSPVILLQKSDDFYFKFHKCTDYLEYLLKQRHSLIMDRLPPFLKIFRLLLSNLCDKCNSNSGENELNELNKLADCAHQLEKIMRQLVFSKKHIARIAPHLIADILHQYERATLYPKVKIHLNNCIYCLISLCDNHAVSYLLRVLSNASTELFKIMFDNYKKFYRFTGKV